MAERVEDLNLPNAVVTRIIKECLPDGVAVAKDARTAIARAASVFVLFLTSGANAAAQKSHRKTITANDVFITLENAEFQYFIDPLKDCLEDFKKSQQVRKQIAAARKKETEESKKMEEIRGAEDGGVGDTEVVEIIEEEEEERTQVGEEEVEQSREEIS